MEHLASEEELDTLIDRNPHIPGVGFDHDLNEYEPSALYKSRRAGHPFSVSVSGSEIYCRGVGYFGKAGRWKIMKLLTMDAKGLGCTEHRPPLASADLFCGWDGMGWDGVTG